MTIKEIASMAGVSPAAVSRYLNDGYISDEKKEKIRKVIEETGYRPSAQAQMLRTKKTKLIGVVLPKLHSEAVSRVASGISKILGASGYQMLLASTDNDTKKEMEYLRLFEHNPVDGMILIATVFTKEHREFLQQTKIPIVAIGQYSDQISCIYHDDYKASKELTECLLAGKRNRIGYLGVSEADVAAGQERKRGFMEAMLENKRQINEDIMLTGEFSGDFGYEGMKRILNQEPNVDGVFCATDSIAVGAMQYLRESGKRVPEDIGIVGIGHTKMSQVVTPCLTTVHFYYMTSGEEAARLLLNMIEGERAFRQEIKLGYEIVYGESH